MVDFSPIRKKINMVSRFFVNFVFFTSVFCTFHVSFREFPDKIHPAVYYFLTCAAYGKNSISLITNLLIFASETCF